MIPLLIAASQAFSWPGGVAWRQSCSGCHAGHFVLVLRVRRAMLVRWEEGFGQACQSKVIKLAAVTVSRSSLPCTFTCRTTHLSTWLMVECILNTSSGVLDAESVGEEEAVVNGKCVRKGWRCPCLCSSRGGPGQTARF